MNPEIIVTAANAVTVLSALFDIGVKVAAVLAGGDPVSIEDELKRLDASRLRPSGEIIQEADKASGKEG